MTPQPEPGQARAATLRREFDQAFAAPAEAAAGAVDLLALRVAGERYALRLSEIGGLHADRRIVALPGAPPELLGLAGLRGGLVAVYDLGAFLGAPRGGSPRWVVLAGSDRTVGLAFEELERYLRVATQDLKPGAESEKQHFREAVNVEGEVRPVIDLASIVGKIKGLARPVSLSEER
jgi:purine-binding chemotaxis protein CheW